MRALGTTRGTLEFGGDPWLMARVTVETVPRAHELVAAGARIIAQQQARDATTSVGWLREALDVPIAIISGHAELTRQAIAAGASIVRVDRADEVAAVTEVCAETGAGLVVPLGTPPELLGGVEPGRTMFSARPGPERAERPGAGARPLLVLAEEPALPVSLAAVAWAAEQGADAVAVADPGAATDFLAVHAILHARREIAPELRLPDGLRREPTAS